MTRDEFVAKAVREAERKLGVPAGWWGTSRFGVRAPVGHASVRHSSISGWRIYGPNGAWISSHDSRAYAIKKLVRIVKEGLPVRAFKFGVKGKPI